MVSSLLALPDEALRLIFLSLGASTINDHLPPFAIARLRTRLGLAGCNRRLNTIYRNTVTDLLLQKNYSESDCSRMWERFPRLAALNLELFAVPGFRSSNFTTHSPPGPWCGAPAAYPAGIVRMGIKSISLYRGFMHVRGLQSMLERFTGLESLSFMWFGLHLDRESSEYSDEACSFSLEQHATTLQKLSISSGSIINLPGNIMSGGRSKIDFRWLKLSSLSALLHLDLSWFNPIGDSFSQLAALKHLDTLSLESTEIDDEQMQTILPSLSQLRTVKLAFCKNLSYRVLMWLPLDLDLLDISDLRILTLPQGAEELQFQTELRQHSLTASGGAKRVQQFRATGMLDLHFEPFLRMYSGASIRILKLGRENTSACKFPGELVHLLSKTPNLLELSLVFAVNPQIVYPVISQLSNLRNLAMYNQCSVENLCILTAGPVRHSLRHIRLWGTCEFRLRNVTRGIDVPIGIAAEVAFRDFVTDCFDRCVVKVH